MNESDAERETCPCAYTIVRLYTKSQMNVLSLLVYLSLFPLAFQVEFKVQTCHCCQAITDLK